MRIFSSVRTSVRTSLAASLTLGCLALAAGCMPSGPEAEADLADDLSTTESALVCSDASCDGLLPTQTTCSYDAYVVASSGIFDRYGAQIGGLGLFYSPTCHTVWGSTAFYQPQSHRTCAVRRRQLDNEAICQDYPASRGNVSPMRFLPVGKSGFGRMLLLNDPNVTARTPDFTRAF
jgi:hypothetical protein